MPENRKTPSIRFAGFVNTWEQRKLGELLKYEQPQPYIVESTDYCDSYAIPVLTAGQSFILGYTDEVDGIKEANKENPVIIFDDFTTSSHFVDFPFKIKSSAMKLLTLRDENDDISFVLNTLKNISFTPQNHERHWISKFSNFYVSVPNDAEQKSIGAFFSTIDYLITLHQRKYEKMNSLKKSMLEKMFPKNSSNIPEMRFARFTAPWEPWKLGELLNEVKRPVNLLDNEDYQLVTVKRRNEGVCPRGILKGKDILVKSYFEVRAGDYLVSKRQVVHGANGIVPKSLDRAIVSNEYLVSIGNDLISADFLALLSKHPEMYRLFFISSYGVDIEKLVFDVEDWKKRTVLIPTKDEQHKICEFFDKISDLITLHQRKLEKLRNIKESMLEKMFV